MTDSQGAIASAMAQPKDSKAAPHAKRGGGAEPLVAAAVVFFLLAVVFAAAPALKAGPVTLAGLLLLIGLAGVAILGLFVLRGSLEAATEVEPAAERLIDALSEPAALAAPDGRIKSTNGAWKSVV